MSSYDEDRSTVSRMVHKMRESPGKEGVYYIVRFPTRWRLYAFPWEDFGDLWHGDVWRRYVADDLAEAWKGIANVSAEQLKLFWKGFSRGRIERVSVLEYTVFHGDDFSDTGVTPQRIETAFELVNSRVKWSFDPHEVQDPEHRAALLRLLPVH